MGLSRYKVAPGSQSLIWTALGISTKRNSAFRCVSTRATTYSFVAGGDYVPRLPLARARGQLYGDSGWGVDNIERVVDELASKGVVFERYEEGPIITNEKGIATFERDAKVAYFKDPDGVLVH